MHPHLKLANYICNVPIPKSDHILRNLGLEIEYMNFGRGHNLIYSKHFSKCIISICVCLLICFSGHFLYQTVFLLLFFSERYTQWPQQVWQLIVDKYLLFFYICHYVIYKVHWCSEFCDFAFSMPNFIITILSNAILGQIFRNVNHMSE